MEKAHGVDISKYQVSWNPVQNPPRSVQFITQRTSYALKQDELFLQLLPGVKAQQDTGSIAGNYHYYSTGIDVKQQIKFLGERLKIARDFGIIPYYIWWDYEKLYNNLNKNSYQDLLYAIPAIEGELGLPAYLYCNEDVWVTLLEPYGTKHREFKFAYAAYYWYPNPDRDPVLPKNCKRWDFWQYEITKKYSVISTAGTGFDYGSGHLNLDLDVYNGTFDQLKLDLGVEDNTQPPVTQPIDITAELAAIRNAVSSIESKV
jgi:GH25 family lysozyme M1 (1,4-beta-N-acetylmuramidase)